jgi:hypothetical protein
MVAAVRTVQLEAALEEEEEEEVVVVVGVVVGFLGSGLAHH